MRRSYWNVVLFVAVLLLGGALVLYYQIMTGAIALPTGPRPLATGEEIDDSLASSGLAPGQQAPEFTLQTLEGDPVSLSELRGQQVLINFWATWCPPCRREMPAMERAYKRHQDAGFVVLAVNVQESEETIRPFVEEMGVTFPIVLDESGVVMRQYKVTALPSSFFVDRRGAIHVRRIGEIDEAFIEGTLEEMQ